MTLRIISENSARNLERSLHTGGDIGGSLQDTYMTRMTKLVPAEAITTYPLILNTVQSPRPWQMVLVVAAVVLVVVIVLRWSATKGADGKAQWPAVILSAISFVIWVIVLGANSGDFAGITANLSQSVPWLQPQLISSLVLFAWTAIAPALYTGDRL
jgi:hypothetical protein